ncbi:MAG: thiamine phosphate synthase, partial [Pedobacter sp.]
MKKYIERFQFITHDLAGSPHLEQVQKACNAGAKWIQYRCLTKSDNELLSEINAIAEVCDDWGTTLIVTDHIHLAGKADIQGFHIEDPEADPSTLRKELGEDLTLGYSASNPEDALSLANKGADYIGFGPFALTLTKPNTAGLITVANYMSTINKMRDMELEIPLVAVGGITLSDVGPLMATGIYGIAVSSAVNLAEDLEIAYNAFNNE